MSEALIEAIDRLTAAMQACADAQNESNENGKAIREFIRTYQQTMALLNNELKELWDALAASGIERPKKKTERVQ